MLSRRNVISAAALSPLAAALAPLARAQADAPVTAPSAPVLMPSEREPRPPTEFSEGLELAGGFRVARACDVHYGALPFVLEGEGERFQADVLRRDASGVAGVYDTNHFSVFVSGGASAHTDSAAVRGARALGAALERRLAAGADAPALLTFEERQAAHPDAAYAVDLG